MKVTVLGSGCIMPWPDRKPSSYLIETGNKKILIDMGPGIFHTLAKTISNPYQLDVIILTHFHLDHMADLWPWLFGRIWAGNYYPVIKTTKILTHPDFIDLWENKKNNTDDWLIKVDNMDIRTIVEGETQNLDEISVEAMAMNHKNESLGYRIHCDNKTLAVSGDTGPCENLVPLYHQADLGIVECSFDDNKVEWHLYPEIIEQLLDEITIEKMMLSHFYPGTVEGDNLNALLQKYSNVCLARDGFTFSI